MPVAFVAAAFRPGALFLRPCQPLRHPLPLPQVLFRLRPNRISAVEKVRRRGNSVRKKTWRVFAICAACAVAVLGVGFVSPGLASAPKLWLVRLSSGEDSQAWRRGRLGLPACRPSDAPHLSFARHAHDGRRCRRKSDGRHPEDKASTASRWRRNSTVALQATARPTP